MRIMHMSRAAETLRWFLTPVMNTQKRLGHYVCICTSEIPDACIGAGEIPDAVHLQNAGFEVFSNGLARSINPVNLLKAILTTKRVLKEKQIDVIICHNPLGAIVGRIAARLAKTPRVIYFAHGLPCAPGQNIFAWQLRYRIEKMLGRITDAILVMNDYDENLCKGRHIIKNPDKIFRIPGMGVDLTRYNIEGSSEEKDRLAKELSIDRNKKIVLFIGRMIPAKGAFVLTEAARKICAQRKDVCFLFAGGGVSLDALKRIVRDNQIEDYFRFLGWRKDIPRILKAADIFALPTYYNEGLPVSILEAMACGKPVVATKHRGCEDVVVDGETGFLVPVRQAEPVADKIMLLVNNEQLRTQMGRAGRQRIEQYFELGYCTNKIVEALEKAMR